MPLVSINKISENLSVGIWEVVEDEDAVFKKIVGDNKYPPTYLSGINQQLQWMCTRLLLRAMDVENEIVYDEYNKPFLQNSSAYISISHSNNMVAVALNLKEETGIDIELMKGKAKIISKKFMNVTELVEVDTENENAYYVYWCAKESLYKLYGKKELIFKDNMHINRFVYQSKFELEAKLAVGAVQKKFLLSCEEINGFMLVYIVKQLSK